MPVINWFSGANLPVTAIAVSTIGFVLLYCFGVYVRNSTPVSDWIAFATVCFLGYDFYLMRCHGSLSQSQLHEGYGVAWIALFATIVTYCSAVIEDWRGSNGAWIGVGGIMFGALSVILRIDSFTNGHADPAQPGYRLSIASGTLCLLLIAICAIWCARDYWRFLRYETTDRRLSRDSLNG